MISSMLSHAGAVRIDHILGMFRLWWIPEGMTPDQGAYQRYDYEAMIGVLALEAHRANAVVIGEDLGTVEGSVRAYLARRGILGTSVLWFETGEDGSALVPDQWRAWTLASVATHDLPPALGFLAHDHILLRQDLGLLAEPVEDALARRGRLQEGVRQQLVDLGLLAPGDCDPQRIVVALHRFLAKTPATLKCVALVDAVGERRTQNQPGTVDEYPNWRVPLANDAGVRLSLEQVMASHRVAAVTQAISGKL
jgi:4-alpha-glucanotransferase